MENATFTLSTSPSQLAGWTDPDIVTNLPPPTLQLQPRQKVTLSDRLHGIMGLLFAVTVTTSGVQYFDYRRELRRTVSSPIIYTIRNRRGRAISFAEAWDQASRIVLEAEQRRVAHRELEARQWVWLPAEDDE